MGTGILAALNRNGRITPFIRFIDHLNAEIWSRFLKINYYNGIVRSVSHLTEAQKLFLANERNYQTRAEIALDVASAYPGGDYFEFGSSSLASFRSFLGAFQIFHSHTKNFPSTRFYAFDIFGNPDGGSGPPVGENEYFESWRQDPGIAGPRESLNSYRDLKDRCVLVPGYFQDTLNDEFKAKMRAANQKIGFAFIDVNTASSYKFVFDFLLDVIGADKMYIYLDEYFMDAPVPVLYQMFVDEAKKRHGLSSIYMRNAGNFGALFCLMPPPAEAFDAYFPNGERIR